MDNPSLWLKEKVIGTLNEIDTLLDIAILYDQKNKGTKKKIIELKPSNFDVSYLKNATELYPVEKFLQSHGIDFYIDFDFVNDTPNGFLADDGKLGDAVFGTIHGKPTELKAKINNLKSLLELNKKQEYIDPSIEGVLILEILKNDDSYTNIKVVINKHFKGEFKKNKAWRQLYQIADERKTFYDRATYNYFNSNKKNPLYAKYGFKITKILKKDDEYMMPAITIELVTQKKLTQRNRP